MADEHDLVVITEARLRRLLREELERLVQASLDPGFLEIDEAAKIVGVKPRTLATWARKGRIPATKAGRNWRFRQQELADWMRTNSTGGRR